MLKTGLGAPARLCRAALSSTGIHWAASSARQPLRHLSRPAPNFARLQVSLAARVRFYSSEPALDHPVEEQDGRAPGPITRFADLASLNVHKNIVDTITRRMGYENMTGVQSLTIEPALAGKDLVAQAKTGTGKTLAFLVPTVQRIIAEDPELAFRGRTRASSRDIRAIILSPTRELAEQIGEEARRLTEGTGVVIQTAVGGTQKRAMLQRTQQQGCHILVATPGRLHDLLQDEYSGIDAPNLSALVLDEADRMLDVGFEQELRDIVRLLPNRAEKARQTLLFSATIPKDVVSLARSYVDARNFEFVQTVQADEAPTHEKVPQFIVPCRGYGNIHPTMLELLKREIAASKQGEDMLPFKAIVFLPTTVMVEMTSTLFRGLYSTNRELPKMYTIHSKLTQRQRTSAADRFREAESAILFSSDVTARGMDFPNVSHVIQVGAPPDREQYIHRLGRTGRADKSGQGWLLVADAEVPVARQRLPGLPIQRHQELPIAQADLAPGSPDESGRSPLVEDVRTSMARLPRYMLADTYKTILGAATRGSDKQEIVDSLNDWVENIWGWNEPPAFPPRDAQMKGLSRLRGVRIGHPDAEDRRPPSDTNGNGGGWGRGSQGRDGGRDGGRDFGSRGPRQFRDDFEKMEYGSSRRGGDRGDRGDRRFNRRSESAPRSSF